MKKINLKNRKGQKIVGLFEQPERNIKGTAILQHGWGGNKERPTMLAIKKGFHNAGFQTFIFDTTNAAGESDGDYDKSCQGLHTEDFFDVMAWAKEQKWYSSPIALTGHSMGGYSVTKYTEEYPNEIDFCIPVAPVVSGKLVVDAYNKQSPEEMETLRKEKVLVYTSKRGIQKKKQWWQYEEWLNHDLLPEANNITCRILVIVGSADPTCMPEHMQLLVDQVSSNDKEVFIIEGAPHSYDELKQQKECSNKITDWLKVRGE